MHSYRARGVIFGALCGVAMMVATVASPKAQGLDDVLRMLQQGVVAPKPPGSRATKAHPDVATAQGMLNRLGYDAGPVDGEFGDRTQRALNAFQQDHRLPQTPTVDQTTLQALAAIASGQPAPPQAAPVVGAGGPSFDCVKAATPTEKAICASPDLSALDRQLATLYQTVLANRTGGQAVSLRDGQRAFLAHRNACGSNAPCLIQAYMSRLATLIPSARETGIGVAADESGTLSIIGGSVAQGGATPGNDLSALRAPPAGVTPLQFTTHDGLPAFSRREQVATLIELIQVGQLPGFLQRNECAVFPLFFDDDLRNEFAEPYTCGQTGLVWRGEDEFARAAMRQRFYDQHVPRLMAMAPSLPLAVALVDDLQLNEFDAATVSFPVGRHGTLLETVLETDAGYGLQYAGNGSTRDDPAPSVASATPLPAMIIPMESAAAAEMFIREVNSWTYQAFPIPENRQGIVAGPGQTGQRTVRRVAVVEFISLDAETRRIDTRVRSVAAYNLDLTRKIYEFPLAPSTAPIISEGLAGGLEVPSPVSLDETYLALRHVRHFGDDAAAGIWESLSEEIRWRDRRYYETQDRNPANLPVFGERDARRPFFAKGDEQLTESRWPLFRNWAAAYAAALPDTIEYVRDYTNFSFDPSETYAFSAAPGESASGRVDSAALSAIGLQPDQLVAVWQAGNVVIAVPNRVDLFTLEVPGSVLAPYAGKKILRKTLMRASPDSDVIATEAGNILLIRLDPVSFRLEVDGKEIAARTFEDIPRLDEGFASPPPPAATGMSVFDTPLPIARDTINLLLAATLDPADPLFGGLVRQRWQLEQAGAALGGAFFVTGKRQPSADEARALAIDFAAWARARAPSPPAEIVLTAGFDQPEEAAPGGLAWSSLTCVFDARNQEDMFRISGNARARNADEGRKEMAVAGNGSWTAEDDARLTARGIESLASQFVLRLGCDQYPGDSEPLPVYAVIPAVLPVGPPEAMSAEVRLRATSIRRIDDRPNYLDLLPPEIVAHLVSSYVRQQQPGDFVRLDAELVDVVYRDAAGAELARHERQPALTLDSLLEKFKSQTTPAKSEGAYGLDIIGIRIGMSFDEAEALIRAHMPVGKVLTGMRALDGSLERGAIRPATSGKLFISEDGAEYIALIDEAPAVAGKVLAAWRRQYLAPNQVPVGEIMDGLRSKYGDPGMHNIEEGVRNYWSTPAGNNCRPGYAHGGQKPALSASWSEGAAAPAILALPDGRPVPDAMLPMAMIDPLAPGSEQLLACGPVFTAEMIFDASGSVNAGYPTQDRDWVEQIITDVGPYVEAFRANRNALQAVQGGSGAPGGTASGIKF